MTGALDVQLNPYVYLNALYHPTHCPFRLVTVNGFYTDGMVITPGCLVYQMAPLRRLYDPCRVLACDPGGAAATSSPVVLRMQDLTKDMLLPFDPLSMVDVMDVRGGWPPPSSSEMQEAKAREDARRNDLTRELPSRLASTELLRMALLESRGEVGSPNSFPGAASVGVATEETGTRHCDLIQVSFIF